MVEILAPAGSYEALKTAINTGADAVYLGLCNFSARRNAKNFTEQELYEAAKLCRLSGVKLYLTLNTLVFDDELPELCKTVKIVEEAGVDAVIVQDLGVLSVVKEAGIKVHASTQMTINSVSGAEAARELGFSRVVLARELSFPEIAEIASKVEIETEVFIHGALCVSVSGQCHMSAFFGSEAIRSANRGLCAQPCRLNFKTLKSEYTLSLKDLSIIKCINELEKAGVTSIKIEGRMKRPEYVAAAVEACIKSRKDAPYDEKTLKAIFSRGGFTDGYFTGKMCSMRGFRSREDVLLTQNTLKNSKASSQKPEKCRKNNKSNNKKRQDI
ncbi:MAG: U32 family peptidase [Oscillospiraceae bacterium]|jgi:putative protease|nr:U32 family peptidase [Oscillospiraceae bacterium]